MPNASGRINLSRTRVAVESTLGADLSASIASFGDLRALEASMPKLTPEVLKDGRMLQYVYERPFDQFGFRKSNGLTVKGNLYSTGQALTAAASVTKTTQSKMLEVIAGGYNAAAGTAYASAGSTTGVTVTAGQGSRLPAGTIGWFETGSATGIFYARKIATRSTDALTWSIALADAMASGATILNSQLIYPTQTPTGSLVWIVEGENREEIYQIAGCQGDLTLEWKNGAFPTWSTNQQWATWFLDTEFATPLGGSALAAASYDAGSTVAATSGGIIFTPAGGTVLTTPGIVEFSFNPGIKYQQRQSFNGVGGVAGYSLTPDEATCTILLPFDRTYETARDAQTKYQLLAQAGRTAGRQLALELPCLQIVEVAPKTWNGLRYMELTCRCLLDENTGGQTTDLLRAPWRLACG
jgi:hypothetical protein